MTEKQRRAFGRHSFWAAGITIRVYAFNRIRIEYALDTVELLLGPSFTFGSVMETNFE